MNQRHGIIVWTFGAAVLVALVLTGVYPKFKTIEKRGPAVESVAAVMPGDIEATAALLGVVFNDWAEFDRPERVRKFQNKFPEVSRWNHFFAFRKGDAQHPLFPSDAEIQLDRGVDTFVENYVRIPAERRTRDVYLYEPSGDYYWESEYFYKGQAAKFRCSFLIHLEPDEKYGTRVEVFEYQPTIWVGEYLGMSAHAILPTMLHDIRLAEATTMERKELLEVIRKAQGEQSTE
jgi:hypothetical protein